MQCVELNIIERRIWLFYSERMKRSHLLKKVMMKEVVE